LIMPGLRSIFSTIYVEELATGVRGVYPIV
jgi:hypothetical protein